MAGHILRDCFMPVDYKEDERSNLVLSEFHHIVDTAFFIYSSMIFYFSGTGNSKWIAKQLSNGLSEDLVFIPDAMEKGVFEYELKEDEKIGFVFPIYSWAPPVIVQDFIKRLVLKGYQNHYLFFVCSCGDDTGLTQQVMTKALGEKHWACNAAFSVIMPNNYVLFPGFDVDSKELERKKLNEARAAVEEIKGRLDRREAVFACKEGSFPFIKTRVINPFFVRYQMDPKHFYATDACVGCKRCEKACPVNNVTVKDGMPSWGDKCTSCLACYHVCPQQAVQYAKKTKGKGHYFNPDFAF